MEATDFTESNYATFNVDFQGHTPHSPGCLHLNTKLLLYITLSSYVYLTLLYTVLDNNVDIDNDVRPIRIEFQR